MTPDPAAWAARYRTRDTPWDLGGPHPELARRLAAGELGPPARVLVPGSGRGHDAAALAEAGWSVTAVDGVELRTPALERVAELGGRVLVGDALALEGERAFELVFDHTFFCAIDPAERFAWGRAVERLLVSGGRLAALVFPVGRRPEEGGPPHGMSVADLRRALPGLVLERDEPVERPGPGRRWPERWASLRRDG